MKVHAVCDLNESRLAEHQSRYSPAYVTTEAEALLADPDIDIVVIGTLQDLHASMIVKSLNAGKWVLCEKPMAETSEETAAVLEAERNAKGRLAIGFNRRFAPAYARTKRLLANEKPPFFINYRMMWPSSRKTLKSGGFYQNKPHILYEGTHILDYVCWLLDAVPVGVYMTGDRCKNNLLVLNFADGSRVSVMLGSMGSYALWKEYMEVFAGSTAITVSDFVDMRVRGVANEFDEVYPCHLNELDTELRTNGFDYYEACRGQTFRETILQEGMGYERVLRPGRDFGPAPFVKRTDYSSCLVPDKGWVQSLEHFADCFLNARCPINADGRAGALSTQLALRAVESLECGNALDFHFEN